MWLWLTFIDKEKKNEGEIRCKEYWYAWFMQQYPIFYESSEVPKSSSNYDKEEMQQFLNNIDMHSSTEWGYELPDPNEKKAQDWFKYNGYNPDELYYKKTWNML